MSIFISIPTLEDPEIYNTIASAMKNAAHPESISIGVACLTSKPFYQQLLYFTRLPNVIIDRYDFEENKGVGRGRTLARNRYDGQDHILQVDSHTHFMPAWDTELVGLWNDSVIVTSNPKTLLTGYLGRYRIVDGERFVDDGILKYSPFRNNPAVPRGIAAWEDVPLEEFPDTYSQLFYPSNKVSAGFIFSDKHFADFSGLNENALFYDEEITQSIELISHGFSLVFPNTSIPLRHLYYSDQDRALALRQTAMFSNRDQSERYFEYINNPDNFWKRQLWEQYAHVDLRHGVGEEWYVPKTFTPLTEQIAAATI
jgi:hypothetical protein